MYQRNDKGQIIGACVLGVFLFFGNMYMSHADYERIGGSG